MDAHIQTCVRAAVPLQVVDVYTFRTYVIDSIECVMDSSTSRIRALGLRNSSIACPDKAYFWRTLAEIASGSVEVGWHATEYGEPLNETDHKTRYVFTWRCGHSVLKFFTKILHQVDGGQSLEWFVCKLTADTDHSGDDTDSDEILLPA